MPFQFVCPYCLHRTMVENQFAGQSGECVNCGKKISIPPLPPPRHPEIAPAELRSTSPAAQSDQFKLFLPFMIRITFVLIVVVPMMVLIYWNNLGPSLLRLKERRNVYACKQNLQRIAKALNAYASQYGTYPPPIVYDPVTKLPMHSWRVLILPQLGEMGLYKQYNFSTPWNSPENSFLFSRRPSVYLCPSDLSPQTSDASSYALIVGKGTLFPSTGPLKPTEISDGNICTLLVVETYNASSTWTQPVDIDVTKMKAGLTKANGGMGAPDTIGGNHKRGATGVFADESPAWLPDDIPPNVLDSLITPRGGELLSSEPYRD